MNANARAADPLEERPDRHAQEGEERQQDQVEGQERVRPLELVDELVEDHEERQNERRPEEQQTTREVP